MSSVATARLACVSPLFVEQATRMERDDWLSYFDPAVVLLMGGAAAPQATNILQECLEGSILFSPQSTAVCGPHTINGVQFVFAPTTQVLVEFPAYEHTDLDPDAPTYVVSGLLELDVDTTTLSATLVGREEYVARLAPDRLDGNYVHISTRLPANYHREWNGLTVVGGGADAGIDGTPLAALDCRADGRVLTHELDRTHLGIRALDGVGRHRSQQLREAGHVSRESIADANRDTLTDIRGISHATAERIQNSARAITHGTIVRESDTPLPNGKPIYIDIETDGLSPTITWLIGVLDGAADDGTYRSFVQRDPDEPGGAIEAFMTWYTDHAHPRPIVAYNGWTFDFTVIHEHITEHCPHYETDWTSTYRFDPYRWAIEEGNAVLPGRTNALEDVAAALGYERAETGLTGAAVARAYQQWMADRSPATEPDWDRFTAYCEDDVRALAVIYEALDASGRIVSDGEPPRPMSETTTQATLSDW